LLERRAFEVLNILLAAQFQLTKDVSLKIVLKGRRPFRPSGDVMVSVNEGCFSKDCLERFFVVGISCLRGRWRIRRLGLKIIKKKTYFITK
jgi:hypothetical protein